MPREILFRGKRIDTREWVYGYYVPHLSGSFIYPESFEEVSACIDPDSVGQWTGLIDAVVKKIFEGDILEGDTENPCQWLVVWDTNRSGFFLQRFINGKPDEEVYGMRPDLHVVGNIHDNPNLLK